MRGRLRLIALGILSLAVISCSSRSFRGISPISPKARHPDRPVAVQGLQPLLRWSPAPEHNARYDLIIYEGVRITNRFTEAGPLWMPAREVYFREGLKEPEHRLEERLRPKTVYFWSIRVRRDERLVDWSGYVYSRWVSYLFGPPLVRLRSPFFVFETPAK